MTTLRSSFDATVKANTLIRPMDAAIVEAGRVIADQIDFAVENLSGQDVTKALYLMPHLVNILRELLATPAVRKAAGLDEKPATVTKLSALRADMRDRAAG